MHLTTLAFNLASGLLHGSQKMIERICYLCLLHVEASLWKGAERGPRHVRAELNTHFVHLQAVRYGKILVIMIIQRLGDHFLVFSSSLLGGSTCRLSCSFCHFRLSLTCRTARSTSVANSGTSKLFATSLCAPGWRSINSSGSLPSRTCDRVTNAKLCNRLDDILLYMLSICGVDTGLKRRLSSKKSRWSEPFRAVNVSSKSHLVQSIRRTSPMRITPKR